MAGSASTMKDNLAPSIDRILTERLNSAFSLTCEKFISYIKFTQMKKNFRMIYEKNPESLKNIHEQLCSQMKKSIKEDLVELSNEHCVDYLLSSLETLKKNQESSQSPWRPSGNPEEDLRDHIYPLKLQHKEDLQAVLTKIELSNEELINEVSVNHAEILHLHKHNDDLHKSFSDVIDSFMGDNLLKLQETASNAVEKM